MTKPNSPQFSESANRTLQAYLDETSATIVAKALAIAMQEERQTVLAQDVVAALPIAEDEDYSERRFRADARSAAVRRVRITDQLNAIAAAAVLVAVAAIIYAIWVQFRAQIDPGVRLPVYIAGISAFTAGYSYTLARILRRRRVVEVSETSLPRAAREHLFASAFDVAGHFSKNELNVRNELVAGFLDGWRRLEQSVQLASDSFVSPTELRRKGLRDSVVSLQRKGLLTESDVTSFISLLRVRNRLVHSQPDFPTMGAEELRAARNEVERLNVLFADLLENGPLHSP
ncbi:hypothetical protein [Mycolicibacterium porcinum]|uniref:hypothetical protein n=1 Tax=Mycolicibacterium porcinum TaxID=39693 RepID=UPI00104236F7|nr:hypothetical protein [Mycolicibacterium porcinum]